jgi:hypothetical protein
MCGRATGGLLLVQQMHVIWLQDPCQGAQVHFFAWEEHFSTDAKK